MKSLTKLLTGRNVAWSSLLMAGLALPLVGCEALEPPESTPAPGEPSAPPMTPAEPMVPPAIPEQPAQADSGTTEPTPDTSTETTPSLPEPQTQP
jgi:hypothetical protein